MGQYLDFSIFCGILQNNNISIPFAEQLWNNLTPFQQQFPRSQAYIISTKLKVDTKE